MSPANIIIETAPTSCAKECARIARMARTHSLPELASLATEAEDEDFFAKRVFETDIVLVALDGSGTILGFIAFGDGWLNHLYVAPDYQRLGIGARLLEHAQETCPALQVWVFQRNAAGLRFYQKHGFAVIHRADGGESNERDPDVLLSWRR